MEQPRNRQPAAPLRNRYFHSPYGAPDTAAEWDIRDPLATPTPECAYFRLVFLELERSAELEGLRILVTSSVRTIPFSGEDTVVLVLHDEWSRLPMFAPHVLAVLKCYGSAPWYPWGSLLRAPSLVEVAGAVNHLRVRAAGTAHAARSGRRAAPPRNVLPVPLGWFKQVDVPWVPFEQRRHDAFFVGSLIHDAASGGRWRRGVKQLVGNPKLLSRRSLLREVRALEPQHPQWRLHVDVSGAFHDIGADRASSYSELMMASRFCLTPRGTSLETFRFFEALRVGTVPISEPLPPRWFYAGCPAPVLRSWSELPPLLERLLADAPLQQELHAACLDWWRTRCSEHAVAERVEDFILRLQPRAAAPGS